MGNLRPLQTPQVMKQCAQCNEKKPLEEFYKHQTNLDGLAGACKPCMRLNDKYRYKRKLRKQRNERTN